MREIARSIARERMKRAGYTKINKKRSGLGGRSFFAVHWREAVDYQPDVGQVVLLQPTADILSFRHLLTLLSF